MKTPATLFLMYHELALARRPLCQSVPGYVRYVLDAREFENQMLAMKEAGLRGVNVSEALRFPQSAIAITFDDGCETDLLAAAPALRTLDFGATFYVVSGLVGQTGYMTLAQLRELSDAGFEIGCHSMTHPYLPDLDAAGLQREIADAKIRLEQMIGKEVEHFSCPGGRRDSRVTDIAKAAGYRSLATSSPRTNLPSTDPFALGRVAITRDLSSTAFARLCHGQDLWKLALYVGMRDGAKRILGNSAYDRLRGALLGR